MANDESRLAPWATGPLCRHYMLGVFDAAIVRLPDVHHLHDRSVHWAFGVEADGACEPLGVWLAPADGADASLRIVGDLAFRGVERLWHVTGGAAGAILERVSHTFSGTSVFSSDDRTRRDVGRPPRRREPSPAELGAEIARRQVLGAVRRHGSFANEIAALDFVSGALQQTGRHSDRAGAATGWPRQRSGAQTVPPGF